MASLPHLWTCALTIYRVQAAPLEAACFRLGEITLDYDFARISEEQTVRGQFVQDVLAADLTDSDRQAILVTGLRALEGRGDLAVEHS